MNRKVEFCYLLQSLCCFDLLGLVQRKKLHIQLLIGKGSFINDINRFSWLFCPSHPHIAPYSQLLVMNFLSILDSSPVTSLMQLGPPIWSQKILIFRVCKSWKKHFCFNVSVKQYSIDHSLGTTLNRCKYPLWQYGCRVYKHTANISVVKITLFNCVRVSTVIST